MRYFRESKMAKLAAGIVVGLWIVAMLTAVTHARPSQFPGPYAAQLVRPIDGDTFVALIRVYPTIMVRVSVRVNGIDTPESSKRFAKCELEIKQGKKAKELTGLILHRAMTHASTLNMRISNLKLGKYAGRILGDVEVKYEGQWVNLAQTLIASGMARPYKGGKKSDWCK